MWLCLQGRVARGARGRGKAGLRVNLRGRRRDSFLPTPQPSFDFCPSPSHHPMSPGERAINNQDVEMADVDHGTQEVSCAQWLAYNITNTSFQW